MCRRAGVGGDVPHRASGFARFADDGEHQPHAGLGRAFVVVLGAGVAGADAHHRARKRVGADEVANPVGRFVAHFELAVVEGDALGVVAAGKRASSAGGLRSVDDDGFNRALSGLDVLVVFLLERIAARHLAALAARDGGGLSCGPHLSHGVVVGEGAGGVGAHHGGLSREHHGAGGLRVSAGDDVAQELFSFGGGELDFDVGKLHRPEAGVGVVFFVARRFAHVGLCGSHRLRRLLNDDGVVREQALFQRRGNFGRRLCADFHRFKVT